VSDKQSTGVNNFVVFCCMFAVVVDVRSFVTFGNYSLQDRLTVTGVTTMFEIYCVVAV